MPSTKISLPADTWVDVSLNAGSGTVTHNSGTVDILFVQAATIPTLSPPRTNAIADILDPEKDRVKYFSGLVSEKIWACSLDKSSMVVTTDSEV